METAPESLLLVEDNVIAGDALARWLRLKGYAVTVCGDGKRAIELVAAERFDLILLDVGVPGANGFDVLRSIRASHEPATLPIIMATALGQSEMIVLALELGAND